jgi:diaminopimelate decarboxylase
MLTFKDGDLYFEGQSLPELVKDYASPFFLFSEPLLRANFQALQRGLTTGPNLARIRYCAKTNNEPAVLKILQRLGSDVMVSHLAEAELTLSCGFDPEQIAFQRPVFSADEIRSAIALGVRFFHAFRMDDISLLAQLALEERVRLRISLRLCNGSRLGSFSPLAFLSRRLGFDAAEILSAVGMIQNNDFLSLAGINFYRGTQIESPKKYRPLIRRAVKLAQRIQSRYNIELEEINLGGGLPSFSSHKLGPSTISAHFGTNWPSNRRHDSLENFAAALSTAFERELHSVGLPYRPALALEPGRSIVADAGILIARVHAREGRWLFLDASRNYLGESFLFLCRRILPLRASSEGTGFYHLSGSTLNTMDIIDFWRRIPTRQPGDYLAFCAGGAYTISRATRYAGLSPAVYLIDADGALSRVKPAEDARVLQRPSAPKPIPTLRQKHE